MTSILSVIKNDNLITLGVVVVQNGRESVLNMDQMQRPPLPSRLNDGHEMHQLATHLFPICRSILGPGIRETLSIIKNYLPKMELVSLPSGTTCLDWTIPDEWTIEDAFIQDLSTGEKLVDFRQNNLHVISHSTPVDEVMTWQQLDSRLRSLPHQPDAIPYVTSYYRADWGFCLSHNLREALSRFPEKTYRVKIQSRLAPGKLTYGELCIPATSDQEKHEEILISTYCCHPSMGNNELSGPVVATALAKWVSELKERKHRYRFVFLPETIGSLAFLSLRYRELKENVIAGFQLTCCGDDRSWSFLPSRSGDTLADRIASRAFQRLDIQPTRYSFLDRGSDERQYCSPGIDLPVVSIMRSKYHEYPEYHTSLDDLSFITPSGLERSLQIHQECVKILEENPRWRTTCLGEPQLGKRGLYPSQSTHDTAAQVRNLMNVWTYCDGTHDVHSLSEKTGINKEEVERWIQKLADHQLIYPSWDRR